MKLIDVLRLELLPFLELLAQALLQLEIICTGFLSNLSQLIRLYNADVRRGSRMKDSLI